MEWTDLKDIVDKELKNAASQGEIDYLQKNLDDWIDALIVIKKNIELQKSNRAMEMEEKKQNTSNEGFDRKSYREYVRSYNQWKTKINFVLTKIEEKLFEVKRLKRINESETVQAKLFDLCDRAEEMITSEQWLKEYTDLKKAVVV